MNIEDLFAYNNYVRNITYIQEIDLARQNNTISKLDATFKYKDVEFISIDKNKISFIPTFAYRIDNINTIISECD